MKRYWSCICCGNLTVTTRDSAEDYQCPACHKAQCNHGGEYREITKEEFAKFADIS